MSKRRKIDSIDTLALQINENKNEFENNIAILKAELGALVDLKRTLSEKLTCVSRYISKTTRAFNAMDKNAQLMLVKYNKNIASTEKYRDMFLVEQQLRTQSDEQILMLEDQFKHAETQLVDAHVAIDDMRMEQEDLQKRFDFVKEADVHNMMEICSKFEKIKDLLLSETHTGTLASMKSTISSLQQIVMPHESDDSGLCIVCKSERSNMVFIPCGHQCVCDDCALSVYTRCPYCQVNFSSVNKVFVVS